MPLHPLQAEWDADLAGGDPLGFPGYDPPHPESVLTGRTEHYALIEGRFDVHGGSMGAVHGERVVRAYRRAIDERLPVVVVTSTGGARMQEGMVSLIQMARTAGAARAHSEAGLLSVAVFGNPTTGGVYASYGSLADVRAAVRGATVSFAGPRLSGHTHRAEHAYESGLVDAVVEAGDAAAWVETVLGLRDQPLQPNSPGSAADAQTSRASSAWDEVQRARAADRWTGVDWAAALCSSWNELRSTDPVTRAGLATFEGRRVVVIAHDRHAAEGRPLPAGFRLAQRAAALASRLGLPLLTFVDTPGADPGPEAEADGLAREIARTFSALDAISSVSVSVCVGEGGSGGALAIANADRLLIQRHAIFSVIAPEGAAAILRRDASLAPEVTPELRLTSGDLVDLGIVDAAVDETADAMRSAIIGAVGDARPGDRRRRFDGATTRWLT